MLYCCPSVDMRTYSAARSGRLVCVRCCGWSRTFIVAPLHCWKVLRETNHLRREYSYRGAARLEGQSAAVPRIGAQQDRAVRRARDRIEKPAPQDRSPSRKEGAQSRLSRIYPRAPCPRSRRSVHVMTMAPAVGKPRLLLDVVRRDLESFKLWIRKTLRFRFEWQGQRVDRCQPVTSPPAEHVRCAVLGKVGEEVRRACRPDIVGQLADHGNDLLPIDRLPSLKVVGGPTDVIFKGRFVPALIISSLTVPPPTHCLQLCWREIELLFASSLREAEEKIHHSRIAFLQRDLHFSILQGIDDLVLMLLREFRSFDKPQFRH